MFFVTAFSLGILGMGNTTLSYTAKQAYAVDTQNNNLAAQNVLDELNNNLQTEVDGLSGYSTGGIVWDYTKPETDINILYRVYSNGFWNQWAKSDLEKSAVTWRGASEFIIFGNVAKVQAKVESSAKIQNLQININNADEVSNLATNQFSSGVESPNTNNDKSNANSELSNDEASPLLVQPNLSSQTNLSGTYLEPSLCDRACWGTNESWMRWDPEFINYKGVVVHHTAGTNNYSKSESAGIVRSIYAYHTNTLGWGDIGYNFLVDKYGQIFEGRYPSRYHQVQGAHAYGANPYTFGISALGNYEDAQPTNQLIESIASIINWKFKTLGINPNGKAYIGTESSGVKYLPTILGHRDVGATACPGRYLYAKMSELKQDVNMDYDVGGAIGNKWKKLGGIGGRLGYPKTNEVYDAKGSAQIFEGGNIYWQNFNDGTYVVWGGIKTRYASMNGRSSFLGYPVSDELNASRVVVQLFENGNIYWIRSNTKTFITQGAVRNKYNSKGGTASFLGLPKSDELGTDNIGVGQIFENGKIFWSKKYGAFITANGIGNLYNDIGSRTSKLGYPISDEIKGSSYTYQGFEGGQIRWTSAKGAWVVYD